jgi:hypothetical protein
MAMAVLAELASVAWQVGSGPSVSGFGSKRPQYKKSLRLSFISRNISEILQIL